MKTRALLHMLASSLHRPISSICMWGMAITLGVWSERDAYLFHENKNRENFFLKWLDEILHHRKFPAIHYTPITDNHYAKPLVHETSMDPLQEAHLLTPTETKPKAGRSYMHVQANYY